MNDKNNILPTGSGNGRNRLSEDKLMAYLEGKLTPAEQHEVEEWLAEDGMESDALEGLQGQHPEKTKHTVNRLNHKLRRTILHKKRRRKPLKNDLLLWITVVVILLLAVLAYIVIRKSI